VGSFGSTPRPQLRGPGPQFQAQFVAAAFSIEVGGWAHPEPAAWSEKLYLPAPFYLSFKVL
jgi:hypothetical protein